MTFICTTLACLAANLGAGRITVDDGQHFLYATYHFKDTYYCIRAADTTTCQRMDGRNCLATKPWELQLGRQPPGLDCK